MRVVVERSLDLLPTVLSKAPCVSVLFVLLALRLNPDEMGLNKGLSTASF